MRRIAIVTVGLMVISVCTLFVTKQTRADWLYTVRRGDTLYRVARKTGVSVRRLRQRNGIRSNRLRIGQRIYIPSGTTYRGGRRRAGTRNYGELNLLARTIQAEAGTEPYVGKVAVGGVILNRVQNHRFPKTIAGVVYQPRAFESVSNGIIYRPATRASQKAARDALTGWDPSGGALYFFNPGKTRSRWLWARRIINRIGKHIFAI
ncbi:MAG: cell wall hydrolase [Bacillota bacterium]